MGKYRHGASSVSSRRDKVEEEICHADAGRCSLVTKKRLLRCYDGVPVVVRNANRPGARNVTVSIHSTGHPRIGLFSTWVNIAFDFSEFANATVN